VRWPWRCGQQPAPPEPFEGESPSDPLEVFAALDRHGVDYVVIGGVAVQAHGNPRTTLDVDLVAAPEPANTERLARALEDLRARLLGVDAHLVGVDPQNGEDLLHGGNFTLATTAGRVDLWTHPEDLKGCPSWAQLTKRAEKLTVRGVPITVVGKDDLLAMKRAAGRDKDRADIAALTSRQPDRSRKPGGRDRGSGR